MPLELKFVRCALCGGNDTRVKFSVRGQKPRWVWIDDVRREVAGQETVVGCRTCGLVYVNPRIEPTARLSTYSLQDEIEYFRSTRERRELAYMELVRRLPEWLGRDVRTLLDIGCGDGALLEVARQAKIESVGTEISEDLRRDVQGRIGKDAIVCADLIRLPPHQYDVVTLINVLEHLPNPNEVLEAASGLLTPGGVLLVHVPNLGGLPARLRGANWHHIEPLTHLYYFTARTLKALVSRAGLKPVGRFSLITTRGLIGEFQRVFVRAGLYLDNGLGVVAQSGRASNGQCVP
jgi:SAM-dependent methyltransferase